MQHLKELSFIHTHTPSSLLQRHQQHPRKGEDVPSARLHSSVLTYFIHSTKNSHMWQSPAELRQQKPATRVQMAVDTLMPESLCPAGSALASIHAWPEGKEPQSEMCLFFKAFNQPCCSFSGKKYLEPLSNPCGHGEWGKILGLRLRNSAALQQCLS